MPNLSKVAADLKKVDEAVRILNTTPGVNVKRAMITAGFPKTETTNETLHRIIRRRLEALRAKEKTHRQGGRGNCARRA